ncbi:MAG: protoporphyrinogen oxidase HemJ [Rickettsiaceae bacterium H1]|nr:protoporphyrinogen oxidase HemJ [Rickettsiaceae bacterium H1]
MNHHQWLEAFHVISVITWMAGMLYLPRLYVYHTQTKYQSESCKLLQIMEKRLLRIIINPAMILTFLFGISLAITEYHYLHGWFHAKMLFVIIMGIIHGLLAKYRKSFADGTNRKSTLFYRILNETITLLMIIIVILAVVKPF